MNSVRADILNRNITCGKLYASNLAAFYTSINYGLLLIITVILLYCVCVFVRTGDHV